MSLQGAARHTRADLVRPDDARGRRIASTNQLDLNFFPCALSSREAQVFVGRWPGEESADALREQNPDLVTWRDRDDGSRMYAWREPPAQHIQLFGFTPVTVALEESPMLFQRLIMDAMRRRLIELGFTTKGGGFVNYSKPSLLAKFLADTVQEPLGIYSKILLDVLFTRTVSGELVIGPVIDVVYTTRMEISVEEWVAAGLERELIGLYVVLLKDAPIVARFPDCAGRLIGRVDGFRGDRCILSDTRDAAFVEVDCGSIAPEPTLPNLSCYLAARYQKAFERKELELTRKLRELVRPRERRRLASAALDRLMSTGELTLLSCLTAKAKGMQRLTDAEFPVRQLSGASFSFDRAGEKTFERVDVGLREFGPYDQQQMRRRSLRLLVVAPVKHEGEVRRGIQELLDGVRTPQDIFRGLKTMYRLDNLDVTFAFAAGDHDARMSSYADAVNDALRQRAADPGTKRLDLIISVIHDRHRLLPDSENPYFQTKALALVTEGIPTQALTIEKLRSRDHDLQYILNTMALACYAKLGGTSHVLRLSSAETSGPTELIFGVGRSVQRVSRFGESEETIGFATVFRANGEYLYNDCTPYCVGTRYESALEETIKRTVERVAAFEQLRDGAPLRLVFHVPRRAGRREKRPILNAVGKLARFDVKFALLHVNDDHNLQVFDAGNAEARAYGRPKPEASFLPNRGLCVAIGPRERLVTFVGVEQYRGYGTPAPLRITLDGESTFKDVDYLAQQLYMLSFMNAGSLNPSIAPVSLSYPEKLAQLTGHLRGVQNWTVELIQDRLGRQLWFI